MTPAADRAGAAGTRPRVQIYILSRDRVRYCAEAVASAVAQSSSGEIEVVVSDNSAGDEVQAMMRSRFPDVRLVRREPPLPALDHFKAVLQECSAEFVVLFHDDDVMLPGFVECHLALFRVHPDAAAVGVNATVLRGDRPTSKPFMGAFAGVRRILEAEELLRPYLELGARGPAPFPGYMYRRALIRGLYLDAATGGKHSDVTFLLDVLARGPVVWTSECAMRYRFHGANDSATESIADRRTWLHYITQRTCLGRRARPVLDLKFSYLARWLLGELRRAVLGRRLTPAWRQKIVARFVLGHLLRLAATRPAFWLRLFRKLIHA